MRPSRPSERSRKGDWQRWAYDSLIALSPQSGPGVVTNVLTGGTHRRLLKRGRVGTKENPEVCTLPVLNPEYYHIGFWYDAGGELHLWRTTEVQHDGQRWARFINPFARPFNNIAQPEFLFFSGVSTGDGVPTISECLDETEAVSVLGPQIFDSHLPNNTIGTRLDLGQYIDFLIYPPKINSGHFLRTGPLFLPPESPILYNPPGGGSPGYYYYNAPPTPLPGPYSLPY
jgi:hypothetical protein